MYNNYKEWKGGEVNFRLTTLVKVLQVTGNVLFYQITEEKNSFP